MVIACKAKAGQPGHSPETTLHSFGRDGINVKSTWEVHSWQDIEQDEDESTVRITVLRCRHAKGEAHQVFHVLSARRERYFRGHRVESRIGITQLCSKLQAKKETRVYSTDATGRQGPAPLDSSWK